MLHYYVFCSVFIVFVAADGLHGDFLERLTKTAEKEKLKIVDFIY